MATGKTRKNLSDSDLLEVATLFKLLGEPMRLRILQSICDAPKSVGEIVSLTGATQTNISKHLALLSAQGLLRREKQGPLVFYSIAEPLVMELCTLVCGKWLGR